MARPGPYNPTSAISGRLVKKILDMEFIEMSEIAAHDVGQEKSRPGSSARPPITNISQWVERFSIMAAAILVTWFPEKAPELFAYQA